MGLVAVRKYLPSETRTQTHTQPRNSTPNGGKLTDFYLSGDRRLPFPLSSELVNS